MVWFGVYSVCVVSWGGCRVVWYCKQYMSNGNVRWCTDYTDTICVSCWCWMCYCSILYNGCNSMKDGVCIKCVVLMVAAGDDAIYTVFLIRSKFVQVLSISK